MKTRFTRIARLALGLLAIGAVPAAQAQYVPVVLTGLNSDVVADGSGPSIGSTSIGLDNGNYVLMAPSFNPTGSSSLPATGLITSAVTPGLTYQLASYTANNTLRLPATAPGVGVGTGTLTFGTAQAAGEVYVLTTSGDGASTATFTVNFSDGTTQAFAGQVVSDWFNGTGFAIQGIGRVQRGVDNRENSATNPRLYQLRLPIAAANTAKTIQGLTVTKTSTVGVLNVLAVSLSSVCSSTPAAGTAVASVANACATTAITLSATGTTAGVGISYQWQRRPAGAGTFTNLGMAQATSTYTGATQTAATDYRLVTTCAGSTLSATSSTVTVGQNTFLNCYCTPTGGNCTNEWVRGLTLNTLSNTGTTCTSGGYANYTTGTTAPTTTLLQGAAYPATLEVRLNAASSQAGLWIDYDHSGTFDTNEFTLLGTGPATGFAALNATFTATVLVPATALTGQTRLRVRSNNGTLGGGQACLNSYAGEVEDYFVTIAPAPACTGTPAGGTATANATAVCPAEAFTLAATGYGSGATGLALQWQRSPQGANTFTDIAGATTVPYTLAAGQPAATDYRLRVTCTASTQSAFSSVATVQQQPALNCYCVPTYASGGNGDFIRSVTLGTLSNNTGSLGNVAPYYHDYGRVPTSTLPVPDLRAGSTASLVLTFGPESAQYSAAWVDLNRDGVFSANEYFSAGTSAGANGTATIPLVIPASALLGRTKLRVRGGDDTALLPSRACGSSASDYGEAEDYLVNIVQASGTANARAALGLSAFPNPAGAALTVRVSAPAAQATVQLLDLTGRVLHTVALPGQQATLPLGGLAAGIYLLRYQSGARSQTIRVNKL